MNTLIILPETVVDSFKRITLPFLKTLLTFPIIVFSSDGEHIITLTKEGHFRIYHIDGTYLDRILNEPNIEEHYTRDALITLMTNTLRDWSFQPV